MMPIRGGADARVAAIGECMVELRERPDGLLARSFGGDTLNTALYLARLGVAVDYVTALGEDEWSAEMLAAWRAEGIGTGLVQRLPGRLPGLYIIQTDPAGERRFLHWRESAAARLLFEHLDIAALDRFDVIYLSGISLSLYGDAGRGVLFEALARARTRSVRIVFDTNFRARGWPDRDLARATYARMLEQAHLVLASVEDLELLYGDAERGGAALLRHAPEAETVVKLGHPASRVRHAGGEVILQAAPVARIVDTTAAGDSFAAAYLAARLRGADPHDAAKAGHDLAGLVVGHPGAIVPRDAMPPRPAPASAR